MLAKYQQQTSRLLRDRANLLTPLSELIDYINDGRDQVAKLTGCIRCLIAGNAPFGGGATPGFAIPGGATPGIADTTITTFQTLAGVEKYHFSYGNGFLKQQYTGTDRITDLITVAVSWGGAARPVMEWKSWEELQALGRIYSVGVYTYPFCAAMQGDGTNQQVYLFPVPGQFLEMEWDALCLPTPMYSDSDYEILPESFTDAVQFFAARFAFLSSQRFGSADLMEAIGMERLGITRAASDRGKVESYYGR